MDAVLGFSPQVSASILVIQFWQRGGKIRQVTSGRKPTPRSENQHKILHQKVDIVPSQHNIIAPSEMTNVQASVVLMESVWRPQDVRNLRRAECQSGGVFS